MIPPGTNLLAVAQRLVPTQTVEWQANTGRAENAAGYQVPTYAAPVTVRATVQPVPTRLFQAMGLEWGKDYVTVYTKANVIAVGRDGSGDKVTYNGRVYLCESATDWQGQDEWTAIVAVRVPA